MTDAKTMRRADYVAFRLETANELMKLLKAAEDVSKNDSVFGEYGMDLYRLRNRLSLQIQNTLAVAAGK